eukprot:scaffold2919_cov161-Amphora_coffeaeformis.AAC.5
MVDDGIASPEVFAPTDIINSRAVWLGPIKAKLCFDIKHPNNDAVGRLQSQITMKQTVNRSLLVLFQALVTLLVVGATLGWGPMQLMVRICVQNVSPSRKSVSSHSCFFFFAIAVQLEDNGSFSERCSAEEREEGIICADQNSSLLAVGLLVSITQLVTPFLGYLMDHLGPKHMSYIMVALGIMGMATTALAVALEGMMDWLLFVAFALMSISSWIGALQIIQVGCYFEAHTASRIIFVLNTLFDSGVLTYWFLWLIQDTWGATTLNIWVGYSIVVVFLYAGMLYFWNVAQKEQDDDTNTRQEDGNSGHEEASMFSSLVSFSLTQKAVAGNDMPISEMVPVRAGPPPESIFQHAFESIGEEQEEIVFDITNDDISNSTTPMDNLALSMVREVPKMLPGSTSNDTSDHTLQRCIAEETDPDFGDLCAATSNSNDDGEFANQEVCDDSTSGGGSTYSTYLQKYSTCKVQAGGTVFAGLLFAEELVPMKSYQSETKADVEAVKDEDKEQPSDQTNTAPKYKMVADREGGQQLIAPLFVLLCFFFGLQVNSVSWNIVTQRDFLAYLGDDDTNNRYLTIFTLLTPVSIVAAPLMDYCILHYGWTGSLQVINVMGVICSLVKVLSNDLNVQIVGFVIFSLYRGFLFGVSFSFLPHIISDPVMGRATGMLVGISGAAFLISIPLANMAIHTYDGDFFVPNSIVLLTNIPCFFAVAGIGWYMKQENETKVFNETHLIQSASRRLRTT